MPTAAAAATTSPRWASSAEVSAASSAPRNGAGNACAEDGREGRVDSRARIGFTGDLVPATSALSSTEDDRSSRSPLFKTVQRLVSACSAPVQRSMPDRIARTFYRHRSRVACDIGVSCAAAQKAADCEKPRRARQAARDAGRSATTTGAGVCAVHEFVARVLADGAGHAPSNLMRATEDRRRRRGRPSAG